MTQNIVIAAGNILTPLGDLELTWEKMLVSDTGLSKQYIPCCDTEYYIGTIDELAGEYGRTERLNSLLNRLIGDIKSVIGHLPEDSELIIATTKGAVDQLFAEEHALQGQPWQLGEQLKQQMGFNGREVTVSAACVSGSLAVIQAAMAVASGRCRQALIIAIDLVSEFVLAGFDSLKALSLHGVRPFGRNRDGLALGDGGAWALISSATTAEESEIVPRATISGWGVACDASHITAPCREGSGLKKGLAQIFSTQKQEVGGINGHGTGTVYNDAMEMKVFRECFGDTVPYCSVKGALGHSLGAAGLVETMLSVKSLEEMVLPPTVGLEVADENAGNVAGDKCLELLAPSILTCNSGFGGINTGVLLAKHFS